MKLQTATRLGLYAALELARDPERTLSAADLAERFGVSAHHLAKVLRTLSAALRRKADSCANAKSGSSASTAAPGWVGKGSGWLIAISMACSAAAACVGLSPRTWPISGQFPPSSH